MKRIKALLVAAVAWLLEPFQGQLAFLAGVRFAVVNVDSTPIANTKTTPPTLNKANVARSRKLGLRGIVTAANGDSIASIYRCFRVKSNDLVDAILLQNTSWGASCTGDVGLYRTSQDGAAVVDVDFFASAVDLNTARSAPLDITYEAQTGPAVITNGEKRIWEALGLTTDPGIEYDVAITLVAAAAAAGSALLKGEVYGGA